ncbi:winged helix-turn-helix domain-containing protein [Pseudomonas sp. NPDC089996]|uniref:winged helix-turn-helix domain-containing protein n=1 Tax=Pseudomonas sp. NPDC089996 TaxID=3364474 RepID=UPI0037F6549F
MIIKATSCRLLASLMESAEQVVSRTTLFAVVWGIHFDPGTKVLEVQLTYLRKVLLSLGCNVRIHTHRGVGLRLYAMIENSRDYRSGRICSASMNSRRERAQAD